MPASAGSLPPINTLRLTIYGVFYMAIREQAIATVELSQGGAVNERQMPFDKRGKSRLGTGGQVVLQQLGITQIVCHSIFLFPLERKSRKQF